MLSYKRNGPPLTSKQRCFQKHMSSITGRTTMNQIRLLQKNGATNKQWILNYFHSGHNNDDKSNQAFLHVAVTFLNQVKKDVLCCFKLTCMFGLVLGSCNSNNSFLSTNCFLRSCGRIYQSSFLNRVVVSSVLSAQKQILVILINGKK